MNGTAGFVLIPSRVQPSAFVVDGKPLNVNVNPCMTSWSFPDCSGLSLALDLRRKEMSVTLETVEGGRFFSCDHMVHMLYAARHISKEMHADSGPHFSYKIILGSRFTFGHMRNWIRESHFRREP